MSRTPHCSIFGRLMSVESVPQRQSVSITVEVLEDNPKHVLEKLGLSLERLSPETGARGGDANWVAITPVSSRNIKLPKSGRHLPISPSTPR